MNYMQKEVTVQAFKFTRDARINAPTWFQDAVDEGKAYIDEILRDGSVRIYGCTIRTPQGRLQAKPGDYIIREPDGSLNMRKGEKFKDFYSEVR